MKFVKNLALFSHQNSNTILKKVSMGCKIIEKKMNQMKIKNSVISFLLQFYILQYKKMITAPGKLYVANVGIIC